VRQARLDPDANACHGRSGGRAEFRSASILAMPVGRGLTASTSAPARPSPSRSALPAHRVMLSKESTEDRARRGKLFPVRMSDPQRSPRLRTESTRFVGKSTQLPIERDPLPGDPSIDGIELDRFVVERHRCGSDSVTSSTRSDRSTTTRLRSAVESIASLVDSPNQTVDSLRSFNGSNARTVRPGRRVINEDESLVRRDRSLVRPDRSPVRPDRSRVLHPH
jgi:hypothetical protein